MKLATSVFFWFASGGTAKLNQTITFGALPNKTFGDAPFAVSASASSGLAVAFSIVSGPATITGNLVTLTGHGHVVVRASQAGNSTYNAAPNVDRAFDVAAAVVHDDSRGWRHHAVAGVDRLTVAARIKRANVSADAVALAGPLRAGARAGIAGVQAVSIAQAARVRVGRVIGSIGAVAASQHAQAPIRTARRLSGIPTAGADAVVGVQALRGNVRLGQASAAIGPDLVEEELDEILFLLEVA